MNSTNRLLTQEDKEHVLTMLDGNISRICVSKDTEEIVYQLRYAVDRLHLLAYNRIKEIKILKGEN